MKNNAKGARHTVTSIQAANLYSSTKTPRIMTGKNRTAHVRKGGRSGENDIMPFESIEIHGFTASTSTSEYSNEKWEDMENLADFK